MQLADFSVRTNVSIFDDNCSLQKFKLKGKNASEQTLNSDELFLSTYCNKYPTRSVEVVNPALKKKPAETE